MPLGVSTERMMHCTQQTELQDLSNKKQLDVNKGTTEEPNIQTSKLKALETIEQKSNTKGYTSQTEHVETAKDDGLVIETQKQGPNAGAGTFDKDVPKLSTKNEAAPSKQQADNSEYESEDANFAPSDFLFWQHGWSREVEWEGVRDHLGEDTNP